MISRYLLDADICVYALSRRYPRLTERMDQLRHGEAVIPVVVYGELLFGAEKSQRRGQSQAHLGALISIAPVVPMPVDAAEHYGVIRAALESKGQSIGNNDLWIAAHALAAGLTLVTNNEREFKRVPGLKVQNWAKA